MRPGEIDSREARRTWRAALLISGAVSMAMWAASPVRAQELSTALPPPADASVVALSAPAPMPLAKSAIDWDTEIRKSYWIPALEILGFDFLLNRFDNRFVDRSGTYAVSASSTWRNLTHGWVIDTDPFKTNQFLHPFQGSMYYGFARSAGQDFWTSAAYTFAGSAMWEVAGETTQPSKNDQIASGIGGVFLGESLFRMANLLLEKNEGDRFWREVGAAVISPSTGFNRLAFGERFKPVFSSHGAMFETQFSVGGTLTGLTHQGGSQTFERNEATADFSMNYGLPGKPDYEYTRPFDYFSFRFTASSANTFENIMTHGLLLGHSISSSGDNFRGVWGLYGSYDYIAPQIFRVSSTALSLGSTGQAWLTRDIALQGTGLLGAGYGAAGTIHGEGERDYHYGATPQALLALRLLFGQRAALESAARVYYVSDIWSPEKRGYEKVGRVDSGLTLRVKDRHAVSLKFIYTRRDATYPDLGGRSQSRGTVGLYYTFLGDTRFGPVRW